MSKSNSGGLELLVRVGAGVGALFFFTFALKLGFASWIAWSADSTMANGKGGRMTYGDGFEVTLLLVLLGAVWCYFAIKPKSIIKYLTKKTGK